jgi:hypothetical protein
MEINQKVERSVSGADIIFRVQLGDMKYSVEVKKREASAAREELSKNFIFSRDLKEAAKMGVKISHIVDACLGYKFLFRDHARNALPPEAHGLIVRVHKQLKQALDAAYTEEFLALRKRAKLDVFGLQRHLAELEETCQGLARRKRFIVTRGKPTDKSSAEYEEAYREISKEKAPDLEQDNLTVWNRWKLWPVLPFLEQGLDEIKDWRVSRVQVSLKHNLENLEELERRFNQACALYKRPQGRPTSRVVPLVRHVAHSYTRQWSEANFGQAHSDALILYLAKIFEKADAGRPNDKLCYSFHCAAFKGFEHQSVFTYEQHRQRLEKASKDVKEK